jgi:hypothetical protein
VREKRERMLKNEEKYEKGVTQNSPTLQGDKSLLTLIIIILFI